MLNISDRAYVSYLGYCAKEKDITFLITNMSMRVIKNVMSSLHSILNNVFTQLFQY